MVNLNVQGGKMRWNRGYALRARYQVPLLLALLSGIAQAQDSGMVGIAKKLAPYEGLLTKGCIGLLVAFIGLIAWEVMEQKRASRSSLDIAKLAAAAAKKKSSAAAPASGALPGAKGAAPAARSFAPPPPPPPPPRTQDAASDTSSEGMGAAPPPPPADNPFAPAAPAGGGESMGSMGGTEAVDSTVAFTPADAGSSGGWADLLQRVRAGEPEAASFGDTPPPSTEQEAAAAPPPPASPFAPAPSAAPPAPPAPGFAAPGAPAFGGAPGAAAEPSASSEAWEALLKRTTDSDSPDASPPPSQDSGKIALGSIPPSIGAIDTPPPVAAPEPPSNFSLPGAGAPPAPAADSGGGFQFPAAAAAESPAPSPFSLPTADVAPAAGGAPSFKLPGGDAAPPPAAPAAGGGGFQLPGGGMDDPSSTLPLSDMFSGASSGAPPSFQLPSIGSQSDGANPFDFSGGGQGFDPNAGRTISLDFSQGTGQVPPPPQPKTEG